MGGGFGNSRLQARLLANEIELAESDAVALRVRAELGLDDSEALPAGTITTGRDSDVLNFTFSASSADGAAAAANTWATAYIEEKRLATQASIGQVEADLEARLDELEQERTQIRAELERLEDSLASSSDEASRSVVQLAIDRESANIAGRVAQVDAQIINKIANISRLELERELATSDGAEIVSAARPPDAPGNTAPSIGIAIGVVLGGIVGVGAALLADNLYRSVIDGDEIEGLGLPLLGEIPKAPRKLRKERLSFITRTRPETALANACEKIRVTLGHIAARGNSKTLLITSPNRGDGKTTFAVNLALASASAGRRVVLADFNFRDPQLHNLFGTEQVPGLSDALINSSPLLDVAAHDGQSANLRIVPAGTEPPNSAAFCSSSLVGRTIADFREEGDLAILDCPPILPVADALSLATHVDGVVLVVRSGDTRKEDVTAAAESIARSGGRLLGIVVNGAPGSGPVVQGTKSPRPKVTPRPQEVAPTIG